MSKASYTRPWADDQRRREYVSRSRVNARKPNPALLAQLRYRTAAGEDPNEVLGELQVARGRRRLMYLDALPAPVTLG